MSNTTFSASQSNKDGVIHSGFSGALTIPEFCRRYGIGRSLVYNERKAGRIIFRKVGSRTLILHGEAERWAASLPEAIK